MENIEKIKEDLKQILSEKRYIHSIGAMENLQKYMEKMKKNQH